MIDDTLGELEALRALAARLIPDVAPWGQFGRPTVVRPAALPLDFLPDLPLPAGSRLLGSCTSGSFSLALLDTEQSPQSVMRFYKEELSNRGWYRHDTPGTSGFRTPSERTAAWALFCRSPQGPSLRVSAIPRRIGSELHLQTETDPERTPCARPAGLRPPPARRLRHANALPALTPPPDAHVESHGIGGGGGRCQAHADLQSDLTLGEIASYFGRLLEEAGWTQHRAGGTGSVAWSAWTCPNEAGAQVSGFFLAFQQDEHRYAVNVDREVAPDSTNQAAIESRRLARCRDQVPRDRGARVEIEGLVTAEAVDALREVILRIVAPADLPSLDNADPQLVVGRLPDTLPVILPLPPASQVLGSLMWGGRATIYVESQTRPRQMLTFYRTHLSSPSWTFFGETPESGRFVASQTLEAIAAQFRSEEAEAALSLTARVRPDGVTEARIDLATDPGQTPRGELDTPEGWEYRSHQPQLPILVAPPGSDFSGGGGSGSELYLESRGRLSTTMDLHGVAGFYGRQFEAGGWQGRGRGEDDVVAWSRWQRRDDVGEPIEALCLVVRHPGSAHYSLLARAMRQRAGPGTSGRPERLR